MAKKNISAEKLREIECEKLDIIVQIRQLKASLAQKNLELALAGASAVTVACW